MPEPRGVVSAVGQLVALVTDIAARLQAVELVAHRHDVAWTDFNPVWAQSVAIAKTINLSRYARIGNTILFSGSLTATSAGTAANTITLTLPVTPLYLNSIRGGLGSGIFDDVSATTNYMLAAATVGGVVQFRSDGSTGSAFGVAPAVTVAAGDVLAWSFAYEVA